MKKRAIKAAGSYGAMSPVNTRRRHLVFFFNLNFCFLFSVFSVLFPLRHLAPSCPHPAPQPDEFRHLVACAGQKPVEAGALTSFKAKTVANRVGASSGRAQAGVDVLGVAGPAAAAAAAAAAAPGAGAGAGVGSDTAAGSLAAVSAMKVPKTAMEFQRDLRRLADPRSRFAYLFRIPLKRLGNVFRGDLDSDILSQMVETCHVRLTSGLSGDAGEAEEEAEETAEAAGAKRKVSAGHPDRDLDAATRVARVLVTLSTCDRFDLALSLLTKPDCVVLAALVSELDKWVAPAASSAKSARHGPFPEYLAAVRTAYGSIGS